MKRYTLKELREENNLTQEKVFRKLGRNKNFISTIKNGTRNPSNKMKSKLAKIYKCTGADIFLSLQTTKCLAKAKEIRGGENKWQQTHAVEVERSILR